MSFVISRVRDAVLRAAPRGRSFCQETGPTYGPSAGSPVKALPTRGVTGHASSWVPPAWQFLETDELEGLLMLLGQGAATETLGAAGLRMKHSSPTPGVTKWPMYSPGSL